MKKTTTILLVSLASLFFTACGGGGSSSDTPPITPPLITPLPVTPLPVTPLPSYTTLSDLEFNTLHLTENWTTGDIFNENMIFKNLYINSDSGPILLDEGGFSNARASCAVTQIESYTYLCLVLYDSGSVQAYGLNISSVGNITGYSEFSTSGDTAELVEGLVNTGLADAYMTGYISPTISNISAKSTSIDIDNNEVGKIEADSILPQPMQKQSNTNSKISQQIDEISMQLLLGRGM